MNQFLNSVSEFLTNGRDSYRLAPHEVAVSPFQVHRAPLKKVRVVRGELKMRTSIKFAVALSLAATYTYVAAAQEAPSGSSSIPKVLQITREYLKPGKA